MPYYLDNAFLLDNPWITVVGCGGTGGFVTEGLCRLFQGREATIVLVDHDRVEPHNLLRQNFYAEDVGRFKSQALADRLARAYGRPVGYSVYPFREENSRPNGGRYPGLPAYGGGLLIGCADNAAARRAMAECLPGDPRRWLIDAGNDTNWGQVLVGNVADRDFGDEHAFVDQTCYLLPAPTVQRPDLLTAVSTRPPDMDCAAALNLTDQDPTINQIMASLALQVVRRMVAGTCPFMGLYLDMEHNGWRWYITEWEAETGTCFGLVEGFEVELGYFALTELAEVTVFGSVPAVERDLYWEPMTLGEIRRQSR